MKKGLTLVEIAIVLIVIGVLMGLAFKGKDLIESAQIKSDMNKIHKIATAIPMYVASNNKLPGIKPNTNPIIITEKQIFQDLIDTGLLSEKDIRMSSLKTNYHLMPCFEQEDPSDANKVYWIQKDNFTSKTNICLTEQNTLPSDDPFDILKGYASQAFICYIENMLDDKNLYSGDGRRSRTYLEPEITDCKKALRETTTFAYGYKIY